MFELVEVFIFIVEDGIFDEVYDFVGGVFIEKEYVVFSWVCVLINVFNWIVIVGWYLVLLCVLWV